MSPVTSRQTIVIEDGCVRPPTSTSPLVRLEDGRWVCGRPGGAGATRVQVELAA